MGRFHHVELPPWHPEVLPFSEERVQLAVDFFRLVCSRVNRGRYPFSEVTSVRLAKYRGGPW